MLFNWLLIFVNACQDYSPCIPTAPTAEVKKIFHTKDTNYEIKGFATSKEQFIRLSKKILQHHNDTELQLIQKKFCNHTFIHHIEGLKFLDDHCLLIKHCLFNKFWWTIIPDYRFFVFDITDNPTKQALDDLYYLCFALIHSKEEIPETYLNFFPLGLCYFDHQMHLETVPVVMNFQFLPPYLYHLDLSFIHIDVERARVIGDYLNALNESLAYLNLTDTNIGPEELKKILPRNTYQPEAQQTGILLWGYNKLCYEYNRLWKTFVDWSFCWIKFPTFLDLSQNPKLIGYQEELNCIIKNQNQQRQDLAQIIVVWEKFKPDHRVLNFCAQDIKPTDLDLSGFQFTPQTAYQLGEALGQMTYPLSFLDLSGTNINLHMFKAICPRHADYQKTGELSQADKIPGTLSLYNQSILFYITKDSSSNALLCKSINWQTFPTIIYLADIINLTVKEQEKIQQRVDTCNGEKENHPKITLQWQKID